jgi:hypothetical protein
MRVRLLLLLLLASGCIPVPTWPTVRPGVQILVTDRATRLPLVTARLWFHHRTFPYGRTAEWVQVPLDGNAQARLKKKREFDWVLPFMPHGRTFHDFHAVAWAEGHLATLVRLDQPIVRIELAAAERPTAPPELQDVERHLIGGVDSTRFDLLRAEQVRDLEPYATTVLSGRIQNIAVDQACDLNGFRRDCEYLLLEDPHVEKGVGPTGPVRAIGWIGAVPGRRVRVGLDTLGDLYFIAAADK